MATDKQPTIESIRIVSAHPSDAQAEVSKGDPRTALAGLLVWRAKPGNAGRPVLITTETKDGEGKPITTTVVDEFAGNQ